MEFNCVYLYKFVALYRNDERNAREILESRNMGDITG